MQASKVATPLLDEVLGPDRGYQPSQLTMLWILQRRIPAYRRPAPTPKAPAASDGERDRPRGKGYRRWRLCRRTAGGIEPAFFVGGGGAPVEVRAYTRGEARAAMARLLGHKLRPDQTVVALEGPTYPEQE